MQGSAVFLESSLDQLSPDQTEPEWLTRSVSFTGSSIGVTHVLEERQASPAWSWINHASAPFSCQWLPFWRPQVQSPGSWLGLSRIRPHHLSLDISAHWYRKAGHLSFWHYWTGHQIIVILCKYQHLSLYLWSALVWHLLKGFPVIICSLVTHRKIPSSQDLLGLQESYLSYQGAISYWDQ